MATNPKPSAEGVWISAEAIQAARELSASPCRCTAVSGPCARHQRYARAFDAYAAARVARPWRLSAPAMYALLLPREF